MSDLSATIQDLPAAGLLPAGVLLLLGLLLWAAGQRVLRPAFALTGLLLGTGAGWLIGTALAGRDPDLPGGGLGIQPWACAAVLGLLLACIGALVYRVAVAIALSLVLAIAGSAAVVTLHRVQDSAEDPIEEFREMIDEANDWLVETRDEPGDDAGGDLAFPEDGASPDDGADPGSEGSARARVSEAIIAGGLGLDEEAAGRLGEARGWTERFLEDARLRWEQLPAAVRPMLLAAALAGLLTGLLLATFAPRFSVSVVTSFGGSLLWMGSLGVGLTRLGASWAEWLTTPGAVTLALWLVVSLLGIAIQWTIRPKAADTGP